MKFKTILFILFLSDPAFSQVVSQQICDASNYVALCTQASVAADSPECATLIAEGPKLCEELNAKNRFTEFFTSIKDHFTEVVLGSAALLFAAASAYLKSGFERLRKRLADPFIKRAPEYRTIAVNALVVGKGGTGKTSVIRAISGSKLADPEISNAENELYSLAHEVSVKEDDLPKRQVLRMFFSDHVGQNPATIGTTDFYTNDKLSEIPKCLIMVVDLFSPTEDYGKDEKFVKPEAERISAQIKTWHREMVQIVTDDLPSGSSIVLFVNKIDKLSQINDDLVSEVIKSFGPLIDELRSVRGTKLRVIVGSAKSGLGICGASGNGDGVQESSIYEVLVDTAEPVAM